MSHKYAGTIDDLRSAVKLFDDCNESFCQRHTAVELLQIAAAQRLSKWDFYPDQWTARQVRECLRFGTVPDWNDDETPRYGSK